MDRYCNNNLTNNAAMLNTPAVALWDMYKPQPKPKHALCNGFCSRCTADHSSRCTRGRGSVSELPCAQLLQGWTNKASNHVRDVHRRAHFVRRVLPRQCLTASTRDESGRCPESQSSRLMDVSGSSLEPTVRPAPQAPCILGLSLPLPCPKRIPDNLPHKVALPMDHHHCLPLAALLTATFVATLAAPSPHPTRLQHRFAPQSTLASGLATLYSAAADIEMTRRLSLPKLCLSMLPLECASPPSSIYMPYSPVDQLP